LLFIKKNDKIFKYLNFRGDFVKGAQKNKTSEAQLRASLKYANSKWRPNVFIDKDIQPEIETRIAELGYKSFNEYVIALINQDIKREY